jgi:lipopolysaccharide export system permease protein
MALLALAMCSFFENMYINLVLSLLIVFGYYGMYVLGITSGQKGLLPPLTGAWLANLMFSSLAGLRLAWVSMPRVAARAQRIRAELFSFLSHRQDR